MEVNVYHALLIKLFHTNDVIDGLAQARLLLNARDCRILQYCFSGRLDDMML